MKIQPFANMGQRTRWEVSLDFSRLYEYSNSVLTVAGMEVWRWVLAMVESNDDTEEAADLRHRCSITTDSPVIQRV